jgi:YHS domain-containing protein
MEGAHGMKTAKTKTKAAAKPKAKTAAKAKAKSAAAKTYCVVCPSWEIKHPERCSNTVTLAKGKAKAASDSGQSTLYFCTRRCKDRYLKAPEAFV